MLPSNPSLLLLLLSSISVVGTAQPSQQDSQDAATSFRPGIAVVTGIFAVVFSLTFLLLLYAKFCHASGGDLFSTSDAAADGHISSAHSNRFSGIDRMAIESLPVFLFSSLRGARAGLECAVCLSRFDDADVLRLLPKCKHAFHLDCVDRWLQAHSSCPLCRCSVSAEDATLFKYSTSSRFLFPSLRREDAGNDAELELELFVAREPRDSGRRGSSRFSIGGSFRRTKEKERSSLLVMEEGSGGAGECYHRFKHWIVISDVVFKTRWSDINSSDLISLNTDLLNLCSSKRFPGLDSNLNSFENGKPSVLDKSEIKNIEEEMGSRGQSAAVDPASYGGAISGRTGSRALISSSGNNNRSMSEITNLSRFRTVGDPAGGAEEEKARRLWLPIARRTVQWFAGRESKGVVVTSVFEESPK